MKKIIIGLSLIMGLSANSEAEENKKANQTLTEKQKNIITISSFTAKGDLEKLNTALNSGLDAGLTISEIKEVMLHLYAYAGFPRSIRGLQTFMQVLDERKAKGIIDKPGRKASAVTDKRSKYDRGKEILKKLTGASQDGSRTGYSAFSPEIETFLKEHLFADIFERDVLSYTNRELVTVSVLISLGGLEPMLESHFKICLNIDLTPAQLEQLVTEINSNVGTKVADAAKPVLAGVLKSKGLTTITKSPPILANGVKIEKVSFHNRLNINVTGNMYLPPNFDKNKKYAAIVVGHPFGGVKEQTSGLHAQKLAELGYITLAYDASFYGESGGTPRSIEVPEIRVEDYSAAIDFLSNQAQVYENRIGVLGICGGGGYAISAAQIDHRIKAVATLSMYDMGRARRQGLGDVTSYEQRMKTLDEIGMQRTKEYGGEVRMDIAAIPYSLSDNDSENTREFFNYYRTPRGQHPNATTAYSFTSLAPMINFFPFAQIETISPRPILMIVGERAVSAYFSEDAFKKAAKPKELFIVPGASHVDLYDRPVYMSQSLKKLDGFFKQYLK